MTVYEVDQIPSNCDIQWKQGDDFSQSITITDDATPPAAIDLTSYTLEAKVITIYTTITMTITPVLLSAGRIDISLTELQTTIIPSTGSIWYLRGTVGGITTTFLEGAFDII